MADSCKGYVELSYFYDRMGDLQNEDFAAFINPDNFVCQLDIMHMLVLDFVMSRKSVQKASTIRGSTGFQKGFDYRRGMSRLWVEQIYSKLPEEYREYGEWPLKFMRSLTYSFSHENDIWKPFCLSDGTAICNTESSPSTVSEL